MRTEHVAPQPANAKIINFMPSPKPHTPDTAPPGLKYPAHATHR